MNSNNLQPGERFFRELRTATFRKEEFQYVHTGIIDEDGETWTTTELDEANIFQVYNQYRLRHGIPFPDEIASLRKHYGLSASKMSQILGFGINQYRMYEDGEVPSLSNARTILAAMEKKVFLSFVEASRSELTDEEYGKIRQKVDMADGDYMPKERPSVFSGFRILSYGKLTAVVNMIISSMGATFVTKMNKLLFYADFIHYKRHGYGISGIEYRALQYGPVPEEWGRLYGSLRGVSMEEYVYPGGLSGIILSSKEDLAEDVLTQEEKDTVESVCRMFAEKNAGQMSALSHLEKAWIDNYNSRGKISYQFAFELNYD